MKNFLVLVVLIHLSWGHLSEQDLHLNLDMTDRKQCLMSLNDAEKSLTKNMYNIESIDDGFFPINNHPSFYVKVKYYFNTTTSFHGPILVHPAAYEAKGNIDTPDLQFQWVGSPIFHYFGPEVVELLSGAFVGLNPTNVHIVLDPICGSELEKMWIILNRLTGKLIKFSSMASSNQYYTGFVTFTPKDNTIFNMEVSNNNTVNNNMVHGEVIIVLMVLAQYTLSLSWMILVPVFKQKFKLYVITHDVVKDTGQQKCCLFWGFVIVTFLSLIFIYSYDVLLFIAGASSSFAASLIVFFPVPAVIFTVGNLACYNHSAFAKTLPMYKLKTHKDKKVVKQCTCCDSFVSVIVTLFLQALSFHIGWFVIMLLEFPGKIGILCLNFLASYVAASLCVSGMLAGLTACTASRKAKSKEMLGGSLLLFGITFITLAYYVTLLLVGGGYQDGLSAIMPSLIPIVFFGLLTWIFSGFRTRMPGAEGENKLLEVMWQQATNGIGTYYQREMKDLPV